MYFYCRFISAYCIHKIYSKLKITISILVYGLLNHFLFLNIPQNRIYSNPAQFQPTYVCDLNNILPLRYLSLCHPKVLLIFFQYLLFIFYILIVCDIQAQTQYDICISIQNMTNFLYHALTKPVACIFCLLDQFYYSAEDCLPILKYFYLFSVQLRGFIIPIEHKIKKVI